MSKTEIPLTHADLSMILESLDFTERRYQDYAGYPSQEFKQGRLAEVQSVKAKIRALRNGVPA